MLEKTMISKWGFTFLDTWSNIKYMINRGLRKSIKHILPLTYKSWDPFKKPFNLYGSIIKTRDGILLKNNTHSIGLGIYPERERIFYRSILYDVAKNPNTSVLDIGAHIGSYALRLGRKIKEKQGKGKVYAFEPDPRIYPLLVENIFLNRLEKQVIPIPLIVSNKTETTLFRLYEVHGHSTILDKHPLTKEKYQEIMLPSITIDDFVETYGVENVKIVKIDVEGAEGLVLQGMEKTISKNKPFLYIEIHGHKQYDTVYELLVKKHNYQLIYFKEDPKIWGHALTIFKHPDTY